MSLFIICGNSLIFYKLLSTKSILSLEEHWLKIPFLIAYFIICQLPDNERVRIPQWESWIPQNCDIKPAPSFSLLFKRVTLDRRFHSQDLLQTNKSESSVMKHKHCCLILKSPLADSNVPGGQRMLLLYSVQATPFLLLKPGYEGCNHCELLSKCNTC